MDEYIKREDAIKAITWNGLSEPEEIIRLTLFIAQKNIRRIPAADVVPKEDLENLKLEYAAFEGAARQIVKVLEGAVKTAKAEAAVEIFSWIEVLAEKHTLPVVKKGVFEISKEPFLCIERADFNELKRKHLPQDCRDSRYFVGCETACGGRPCDEFEAKKEV